MMALILCLCPFKHILGYVSFLKLSLAHFNVMVNQLEQFFFDVVVFCKHSDNKSLDSKS